MARTGFLAAVASLAIVASGCGGRSQSVPQQPSEVVPTPLVAAFTVDFADPPYGSTVSGPASDLQGTANLRVYLRTSSARTITHAYFVLELLKGTTECLRTQIAYCTREYGGAWGVYVPGEVSTYYCNFFVRDNQQKSCGRSFTTDQQRWVLIDRDTDQTVATAMATGGWSFAFSE